MTAKAKQGLFGHSSTKKPQEAAPKQSVSDLEAKKEAFIKAGKLTETLPKGKPARMLLEMPQDLNKRLSRYCLDNDTKKAVVIRNLMTNFLNSEGY